jgi:hypothetical protein
VRNHSVTKAELKTAREKLEAFGYVKPEDIGRLSKLEDNPTAARLAEHIENALQPRLSAVTHEHTKKIKAHGRVDSGSRQKRQSKKGDGSKGDRRRRSRKRLARLT